MFFTSPPSSFVIVSGKHPSVITMEDVCPSAPSAPAPPQTQPAETTEPESSSTIEDVPPAYEKPAPKAIVFGTPIGVSYRARNVFYNVELIGKPSWVNVRDEYFRRATDFVEFATSELRYGIFCDQRGPGDNNPMLDIWDRFNELEDRDSDGLIMLGMFPQNQDNDLPFYLGEGNFNFTANFALTDLSVENAPKKKYILICAAKLAVKPTGGKNKKRKKNW